MLILSLIDSVILPARLNCLSTAVHCYLRIDEADLAIVSKFDSDLLECSLNIKIFAMNRLIQNNYFVS